MKNKFVVKLIFVIIATFVLTILCLMLQKEIGFDKIYLLTCGMIIQGLNWLFCSIIDSQGEE